MKKSTSKKSARVLKKTEPFYIDGCKVMVRYQKENNPQVVQSVRSIWYPRPPVSKIVEICNKSSIVR